MTAPRPSGDRQAVLRGVLVLVFAVVVGLALLSRSTSSGFIGSAEAGGSKPNPSTTSTSTVPQKPIVEPNTGVTEPATQPTRPAAEVKTIVVNATGGQAGVGSTNDALVKAAGFTTLPVSNATAAPATTIYFAEGYEGDANAVQQAVKLTAAPVSPAPAEPVVAAAAEANVIVVLGQDYQG